MGKDFKRYTVTAALPYANGPVHIGHLAGCYLPADIYVRFLKAQGKDVIFICGSDEHGVPITIKAKKEGISPQQVVDKYDSLMKSAFRDFGIDFSYYGRTSSQTHHETARDFFKTLYDKGVFTEELTQQYYDEKAGQFLADRYITGTCPRCGNENAYGDQCEKCGSSLSPTDLINPRSALSGEKPVLRETKNWFLPMGHIQQSPAFKKYTERFDHWKSNIKGQCGSWLNEGLQPRAMTRDLDWGVPVPLPGAEGKVLYVWFDAPIGYISATKEHFAAAGTPDEWIKYWQDEETALIHFIGKDNIVFHAIIFPMMLMQHGNYILPANVPANEFLNLEGDKISTSRNWAVWLHEYLEDFPGRQDELRYVLTSIAPETKDSDFSWKDYQARVNNELVAILGNFVNRVMVLTWKYFEGKVPADISARKAEAGILEKTDALFGNFHSKQEEIISLLSRYSFRDALFESMDLARSGNKFLQETEPWKLIKTDETSVRFILAAALQYCRQLAGVLAPFLPHTSQQMLQQLNIAPEALLSAGHQLQEASLLFKPIEDAEMEKQLSRLEMSKAQNKALVREESTAAIEPAKTEITFEDFSKMDIRVGTIIQAERVPKTDKLLKLTVDTGIDQRTVVSGIAEYHAPENIIGQQVCILINLAPRKMKGIESQGMILMAKEASGKLVFVQPAENSQPGSGVA